MKPLKPTVIFSMYLRGVITEYEMQHRLWDAEQRGKTISLPAGPLRDRYLEFAKTWNPEGRRVFQAGGWIVRDGRNVKP